MAAEYRHLLCSGCKTKLRITITEKHYEMKIEVECKICFATTRTTIPTPSTYVSQASTSPPRSPPERKEEADDDPFGLKKTIDDMFGRFRKKSD